MSVPGYETYQESGVEWLGEVPKHWELKRLAHYFDERREKCSDKDFQALSVTKNGTVPQLETAAKTDDGDNRKKVLAGDFVINSRSDRKGASGLSPLDGSVSLINTVLTPQPAIVGAFAHHLLRSVAFQEEYYRYGKGIVADLWSTNFSEMKNILLAVPSTDEQNAIVAFLHRETGKIDALVEAQRQLIELLKEKRQAVISRAVTKGLDPAAPMKESGVQWLGKVPAHWEICLLKRAFSEVDYGISDTLDADYGVAVLRMGNIQDGEINLADLKYVSKVEEALLLRPRDLLFNRTNSLDQIGKVGLLRELPPCPVSFASYLVRLRVKTSCSPQFMSKLLNTRGVLGQARSRAFVAIGQCNLNPTRYGEITVALPPVVEQERIAEHLESEARRLDTLVDAARAAISLLQERRAALISAAVTGKIDVRGLVGDHIERDAA